MQADPTIQAPLDLQNFSRYSYVMNNPLSMTDPSGFNWLSKTWKKAWKNDVFKTVVFVVAVVYTGGAAYAAFATSAAMTAAATTAAMWGAGIGAVIGGYSGYQAGGVSGMLKGALAGAVVGGVTGAAGVYASWGASSVVSGAIQGGLGGFGTGIAVGYQGGEGSYSSIRDGALIGAAYGAAYGAAIGGAVGYARDWLASGKDLLNPKIPDGVGTPPTSSAGSNAMSVSVNGVKAEMIQNLATTAYNWAGAPLATAGVRSLVTGVATAYALTHTEQVSNWGECQIHQDRNVEHSCEFDSNDKTKNCW